MKRDDALKSHRERLWTLANSGSLPTPHGRSIAPWRELVDENLDRGLPAQDRLIANQWR